MASNLTRKELLKQDKFTVEAEHTVDFLSQHRKEVVRYGAVLVALAIIIAGVYYYRNSQQLAHQQALGEAMTVWSAPVGAPAQPGGLSFATAQAKQDATKKAFSKVVSDYNGSQEAYIAEYYLASQALDTGNVDDARKKFQDVSDHANANYASLAKLALAQLDVAENRNADGEKILKDLMDHPTDLVSKTEATFAYARAISATKPDEARKLYQQIANEKSDAAPLAQTAMNDLPQK